MRTKVLVLALPLLAACGAGRAYQLNASRPAAELFAPIEACATQKGLQSNRSEHGVQVHVDPTAYLEYAAGQGGALGMNVVVDDSKVPPVEHDAKFAQVKAVGDGIFACADRQGAPAAAAPAAAAPAAASGATIDWKGNWTAKVDYTWSCKTSMTKPETGKATGTWTLAFSGEPTALHAKVQGVHDGYDLDGSASAGNLRVCGPFPLKGKSTAAETMNTSVCLIADAFAAPNHATGRVEGHYVTGVGLDCTVQQATLDLSQ